MALLTLRGSVILQHEMAFNGPAHSQLKGSVILQNEVALNGLSPNGQTACVVRDI